VRFYEPLDGQYADSDASLRGYLPGWRRRMARLQKEKETGRESRWRKTVATSRYRSDRL